MNEFDIKNTVHSDPAVAYKKFVRQMTDWYNGGELPELAGQDLRFVLDLQKKKLKSLGLEMKCVSSTADTGKFNTSCISFSDRLFINSIVAGNMNITRSVVNTQQQYTG